MRYLLMLYFAGYCMRYFSGLFWCCETL